MTPTKVTELEEATFQVQRILHKMAIGACKSENTHLVFELILAERQIASRLNRIGRLAAMDGVK